MWLPYRVCLKCREHSVEDTGCRGATLTPWLDWLATCLQDSSADPSDAAAAAAAGPQAAAASSSNSGQGGRSSELARLFDLLVERMRAAAPAGSPAEFFASQDGRSAQLEWFALQVGPGQAVDGCRHAFAASKPLWALLLPPKLQAWNAGQQAGAGEELQQAAVLLGVCGELYAALPAPGPTSLHKQKVGALSSAGAGACLARLQEPCAAHAQRQLARSRVWC